MSPSRQGNRAARRSDRVAALIDRVTATRAAFFRAEVQRDSQALARLALDHAETVLVVKDTRGLTHLT
jgi:hypothetical protein